MVFAGVYAIVVGVGMVAQWALSLARRQVPELTTEPLRIRFHLAAEFATAGALIAGGAGLLTRSSWGLSAYLIAIGMLFYTAIVSPGYFAEKGQWPMVGMFAGILALAVVSVLLVL
jgi:hypothetical protein